MSSEATDTCTDHVWALMHRAPHVPLEVPADSVASRPSIAHTSLIFLRCDCGTITVFPFCNWQLLSADAQQRIRRGVSMIGQMFIDPQPDRHP